MERAPQLAFDLRPESARRARTVQTLRKVMILLLVLTIGLATWFVTIAISQGVHGFQWVVLVVVLSGLMFLTGEFLLVLWKTSRGAVGLAIGHEGLVFEWPGGQVETLAWAALSRGFALYDVSGVEIVRTHTPNLWELRRWNRPISCISKVAFESIIRGAASRGFAVREFTLKPNLFRWLPTRVVRFA